MRPVVLFDLRQDALSIYTLDRDRKAVLNKETVAISGPSFGNGHLPVELTTSLQPTDECYLSLPLSLLNFRVIEMPFSDLRKVRELLPFELEGLIMSGVSSVVFDAFVLGEQNGKYRVFVAYIGKTVLRDILEQLKKYNADPKLAISLELAAVLQKNKDGDVAGLLQEPPALAEEELIETALREMAQPSFNFRRDELAYTVDDRKQKKMLQLAAILLALIAFVFLVDMSVVGLSVKRENQSVRDGLRKTYQEIFPTEKKITDEVYQMKAHLKELKEKEASFVGSSPLQVMLDLSKVVKPGIAFSEVTVESSLIVMKGECPSLGDAQKIKADLEPFFLEVNISETKPSAQGKTQFTMTSKGRKS
jgi:type II secretory pathway component PulL